MIKIGMTGGIASGKTTCAQMLSEVGVIVHEADLIAKEFLRPESVIYASCLAYFGCELMHDKKKLKHFIFMNPEARIWLNNKVHPYVQAELMRRTKSKTKYYHLLVVPLLFENNFNYGLDKVILIHSEYQLERAMKRDHESEAIIKNIMCSQIDKNKAIAMADYHINTDEADVRAAIMQVHSEIIGLYKQ